MRKLLLVLSLLGYVAAAHALPITTVTGVSTTPITVPPEGYDLRFNIWWASQPYPGSGAPGRIEIRNSSGTVVASMQGTVNQYSGPSVQVTTGSFSDVVWWVDRYAGDDSPAEGGLDATWHIRGLLPGNYTLRFYNYTTNQGMADPSIVWTHTEFDSGGPAGPAGAAPSIAWTSAPASSGSGQSYAVSARGHDDDGNLVQVNVWKDGVLFASAGAGDGKDSDSGSTTADAGPGTVTFTAQAVDADGATSAMISHVVTIDAPLNTPPAVTLISPGAQTVSAGTTLTLTAHATDPDGNIAGHNLDIQRPAGDWNWQGGFAVGEPYQGGPVGSGSSSTRSANFTFTDVGTYLVRSAAYDGSGWYSSGTVAITVIAPPAVQFMLVAGTAGGGSVSGGGSYTAGSAATVVAMPDANHDFAGWSGDAGGMSNPAAITMDRDRSVQAIFSWKQFALTTSATAGGSVTPGGSYPYGSVVTLAALPDAVSRFAGWSGDASGLASTTAVTVNGPTSVQAMFVPKAAQTITFAQPADYPVGTPPFPLDATTSSGLPLAFSVLSGPAVISAGKLQVTGPGTITVQASQGGDAFYLPASANRTFNSVAPAVLKYRGAARIVLQGRAVSGPVNVVLEKP